MKERIKKLLEYVKSLAKWIIIAGAVGAVGGAVGSLFHLSIDYVTELREKFLWILYLLPVGGVIICLLYKLSKTKLDTNRVIESVRGEQDVPLIMAPLIFASTVITHFFGGSAGREGAALQLGGSIGYNLGRLFRLKESDLHIIVMAGMSAVFAALFGTPITAIFFALEVTSVGIMYYAGLLPCIISAILASVIAKGFGLHSVKFDIVSQSLSLSNSWRVFVLTALCAVVGILFCLAIEKSEKYMEKYIKNNFLRAFAGGAIIVLLTLVLGTRDYNGAGMDVITRAINGEADAFAFALKIVFTAITISAGFKGGEIVPAFFVGSTFGCVVGGLLGLPPQLGAAIGFVALFCSVTNCPVASLLLALEVFGGANLPLFVLCCGVSYVLSGYSGLYKSQRIMYSKLEAKYVNINAK